MDMKQRIVENSESDTDHQDSDDSPSALQEVAVIVVDNYKYIFKSGSLHTNIRTWRCSFKPSCNATITLNRDGDVIYASNDHCHVALSDQQIQTGSQNEVLLFKKVKRVTSYLASTENMGERLGNISSHSETGCSFQEQESVFPKLGTAFSVAGHKGMMIMNPAIQDQPKRGELLGDEASIESGTQSWCIEKQSENDNRPLVRNPKSAVIHNLSVIKNTRTMQNILAQALQRLDGGEHSDESVGPAVSSKGLRGWRYEKSEPKEESDAEAIMEEEWQRQFMKQEPDEDEEEDDKEINVEVSEEGEQDSFIGEDEMAIILGE